MVHIKQKKIFQKKQNVTKETAWLVKVPTSLAS